MLPEPNGHRDSALPGSCRAVFQGSRIGPSVVAAPGERGGGGGATQRGMGRPVPRAPRPVPWRPVPCGRGAERPKQLTRPRQTIRHNFIASTRYARRHATVVSGQTLSYTVGRAVGGAGREQARGSLGRRARVVRPELR